MVHVLVLQHMNVLSEANPRASKTFSKTLTQIICRPMPLLNSKCTRAKRVRQRQRAGSLPGLAGRQRGTCLADRDDDSWGRSQLLACVSARCPWMRYGKSLVVVRLSEKGGVQWCGRWRQHLQINEQVCTLQLSSILC